MWTRKSHFQSFLQSVLVTLSWSHCRIYHPSHELTCIRAQARPLDVETDLKPVVEFLHSKGVKVGDVYKVSGLVVSWLAAWEQVSRERRQWATLHSDDLAVSS